MPTEDICRRKDSKDFRLSIPCRKRDKDIIPFQEGFHGFALLHLRTSKIDGRSSKIDGRIFAAFGAP